MYYETTFNQARQEGQTPNRVDWATAQPTLAANSKLPVKSGFGASLTGN